MEQMFHEVNQRQEDLQLSGYGRQKKEKKHYKQFAIPRTRG